MIEIKPLNFELKTFDFDSIIFSSKKAVEIFFNKISFCKNANIKVYTIGEKTANSIKLYYDTQNIYIGSSDIKEILSLVVGKTIWVRTELDLPEDIKNILKTKDIFLLKAYETKNITYDTETILKYINAVNGILFASPSAFLGLLNNLQNCKYILYSKELFAIGNTTANIIKKEGYSITYMPEKPSLELIASYIKAQKLNGI